MRYPINVELFKEETRKDAEVPQEEKYPSGNVIATGLMWGYTAPKVGEAFYLFLSKMSSHFRTSCIEEILETTDDYVRFKTKK